VGGREGREEEGRGERGGGLRGGLNREVCRAQLFLIQSGRSVCKHLERQRETRGGTATDRQTLGCFTSLLLKTSASSLASQGTALIPSTGFTFFVFIIFFFHLTNAFNCSCIAIFKIYIFYKSLGGKMDVLPMCSIFQELQIVHDTGYFSALPSLEEYWQQVNIYLYIHLFNQLYS